MRRGLVLVVLLAAGCGGSKQPQQFLSPGFKDSANAITNQLDAQISAVKKNVEANSEIGTGLQKSNCIGTVNTQLTQRAHSDQEKQIAKALAAACGNLTRALQAAHNGNAAQAKALAAKAASETKTARARSSA